MHTVAYDEGHSYELQKKLLLEDAISDLPPVCICHSNVVFKALMDCNFDGFQLI